MEQRGRINIYEKYDTSDYEDPVYTINLANGVTPFIAFFAGKEFVSRMYRLHGCTGISVRQAWYRPTQPEFHSLNESAQAHVLNAGLLCAPLVLAVTRQLPDDPVMHEWDYERFQEWCLTAYGRRLRPWSLALPLPRHQFDR